MVLKVLRSKKFAKRVLLGVLILIIPAFILWGAGSITKGPALIGQIDKQKIYLDDFAKSRQGIKIQVLFTYYGDLETLNQILKNRPIINFMAWERLVLLREVKNRKISIANNDVLSFISQHPLFRRNGVFDKEVYNYILRNNLSIGPRQFEELVRENLQIKLLRQDLLKDISISEEDVLEYYRMLNDQIELSYIIIDMAPFVEEVTVSDEEAKNFYEANKDKFFEPAKVQVEYIEFPYENAVEKNSVTREIEEIYPELSKFPTRFAQTADKYGLRCGNTPPFSRKDVIPGITFFKEFHDIAFAMKEGEISPPIFSSAEKGAAYVLRKVRDIPPRHQSFEEVRPNIEENIAGRKALLLAEKKANDLYAEITETGVTLEKAADTMDQRIEETGPVTFSGYIENVGPAGMIVARARETGQGGIIPPIIIKKGVFVARVDNILPADETGFEENKETLRDNLLAQQQMAALEKWFKEEAPKAQLRKALEEL
jgi:hypothetical protein